MNGFTSVYTHKIKSTGEIIQEMEYRGLCDVDGLHKSTDCAPHDLYSLSADKNDVGCMINTPAEDGDFNKLRVWPGCHVIKRANGTIEVWTAANQPVPRSDLDLVDKTLIIT